MAKLLKPPFSVRKTFGVLREMKGTKPTTHRPGIKRSLWQVLDSEGTVISVFDRVDHAYDFKKKLSDSYYLGKYSLNYLEREV